MSETYDVVIIGGGPAGASAALYAARLQRKTVVLDKGVLSGALGLTSRIANYPGFADDLSGADLVERMRDHARQHGAEFRSERVQKIDLSGPVKFVHTAALDTGEMRTYASRTVILATGSQGATTPLPGEEKLLGRGVSHCAICDAAFFRDESVLVVGGSDEAIREAGVLARFARQVELAISGETPEADPGDMNELLATGKVRILPRTSVRQIVGENEVEAAVVVRDGKEVVLPVKGVFIYRRGNRPQLDYLGGQLPLAEGGCLPVGADMSTPLPGIFACGDLVCGAVQQAVVAAAGGVTAALGADRYLSGRARLRKDYRS